MLSRLLSRFKLGRYSTKAWELSEETPITVNTLDRYFSLLPIPLEKVPLLPPGTVAVQPIGRPSIIDIIRAEINTKYKKLEDKINIHERRIKVLENQPKILQIFESVKFSEKAIIKALLPSHILLSVSNLFSQLFAKNVQT